MFKPAITGEDELRAELRSERKAAKAIIKRADKVVGLLEEAMERQDELLRVIEDRDATLTNRDTRIEELEATIRLRELEEKGLTRIIERDRQRIEAETAIEVARAEAAALGRDQHQQGVHRGFIS